MKTNDPIHIRALMEIAVSDGLSLAVLAAVYGEYGDNEPEYSGTDIDAAMAEVIAGDSMTVLFFAYPDEGPVGQAFLMENEEIAETTGWASAISLKHESEKEADCL